MDHLCCVTCVSHNFASVHCCLVVTCWERTDLLARVGDVYCILLLLGQVWYLIVSFPDLCLLSYFYRYIVTINVLWLFLKAPWVGLQFVIVVFPDHTHLLFNRVCGILHGLIRAYISGALAVNASVPFNP